MVPIVERITAKLLRRKGLTEEDREEFAGHVRLKVVEEGDTILRRFRGECRLETFLHTVVARWYLDHARSRWGRWRPSATARQRGPVAVHLERLLHRDRVPFDQAAEILRRNHGVRMSVPELADLAGQLPAPKPSVRHPEQEPEGGAWDRVASAGQVEPDPELRAETAEMNQLARNTSTALSEALQELDEVDRFLVRSFTEGLKVSEVARMLDLEQKPLYRRRERLLNSLRRKLETRGVTSSDVHALLDWGRAELDSVRGEITS